MSNDAYKEAVIGGFGKIWRSDKLFDVALEAVKSKGSEFLYAGELAFARVKKGKKHSLFTYGSFVRQGVLYVPRSENRRTLLRESLVLNDPSAAVQAHRNGIKYFLPEGFDVQSFLSGLRPNKDYLILGDLKPIPTNRFKEDGTALWLFEDNAEDYGNTLREAGVNAINLVFDSDDHIDSQTGSYANQLWVGSRGSSSIIVGDHRDLDYNFTVRGVSRESVAKGDAQKNQILYTPKHISQLKKVLRKIGIVGDLEKRIISNLKE